MFHLLRPKHKSGIYSHSLAETADINGGAEEMAFDRFQTLPLMDMMKGSGTLAGALDILFAPMVSLHPTGAPQDIFQLSPNPFSPGFDPPVEANLNQVNLNG